MKKYDEKITRNVMTNNLIENLTKDIITIGDDILNLLSDFIKLYKNCKLKYENEIKDYTYELILLESLKSNTDKTMNNYNEYLTNVTYEITNLNVEKEKVYSNLGLLQNCMKKKDKYIANFNRLEAMYCQNTQENGKQNSTSENTSKEHICDIDKQQKVKNVLHAIIEQNCVDLQKKVAIDTAEQAAELKQCNSEECEEALANGVSAYEKASKGILLTSLLYSIINRILLR
ncbi:hypothetical protein BDAP_000507 [Binucleata daphniae]